MNAWLRKSLYGSLGALWLTGCAWLVLHFFFQTTTEFGTTPHPSQPSLLVIHGAVAVVALFLLGWVAGSHIDTRWRRGVKRMSGIALMVLGSVLIVTGFAGYYLTSGPLRAGTAAVHEILGVLAVLPAVMHGIGARRHGVRNRNPARTARAA